jgi:hypothetical protein
MDIDWNAGLAGQPGSHWRKHGTGILLRDLCLRQG